MSYLQVVIVMSLMMLTSAQTFQLSVPCDPNVIDCKIGDVNVTVTKPATDTESSVPSKEFIEKELQIKQTVEVNTSNFPFPDVGNETFDVYLSRYLNENPNAVVVESKGFPAPYPALYDESWRIAVKDGTGIDVVLHYLDINPLTDFLYFRAGLEVATNDEQGPTLTGLITDALKYKILGNSNLYVTFKSSKNSQQDYKGFVLTYAPFGEIHTTVSTEAYEPTVPTVELRPFNLTLELPQEKQIVETWNFFKNLLAIAVNSYTTAHKLLLETAKSSDIIMLAVQTCPSSWPDHENCIRMQFSVPLAPIDNGNMTLEQLLNEGLAQYELTTEHLKAMWSEFGRAQFESNGLHEYMLPDSDYLLLLWTSISLAIVIIFLFVLYSIWKMDFFKDYHRASTKSDDKKSILPTQSDYDISMFPSPHQIVPSFFPSNDPVTNGLSNDIETHPITFTQSDFMSLSNRDNDVGFSTNIVHHNESKSHRSGSAPIENETHRNVASKSLSPTTKQKILLQGMSKHESLT